MPAWRTFSTIFVTITAIWWTVSIPERLFPYHKNNVTVTGPDPVSLVDERQLDEAVSCPVPMLQAKETVLLVHGTGMTWVDPDKFPLIQSS